MFLFIRIILVLLCLYSIHKQLYAYQGFLSKVVFKNFKKFTRQHLCWSLFLSATTNLKWRLRHRCFPVNFCKFFENIPFNWPPPVTVCFRHKMQNIAKHIQNIANCSCVQLFVCLMISIFGEATGVCQLQRHI